MPPPHEEFGARPVRNGRGHRVFRVKVAGAENPDTGALMDYRNLDHGAGVVGRGPGALIKLRAVEALAAGHPDPASYLTEDDAVELASFLDGQDPAAALEISGLVRLAPNHKRFIADGPGIGGDKRRLAP